MAIIITYKKTPPSNETQTLPENTPAKTFKGLGAGLSEPGAFIPFIDRISIVARVLDDKEEANAIYGNCFVQFKDNEDFKSTKGGVWGPYKTARRVVLPSIADAKKWPLLQFAFNKEAQLALEFRTEFSPVDLGPQGINEFHAQLMSLLPNGWGYFVANGRVTMIEVTIDLPNVPVDHFHMLPQQVTTAMTWKTNGKLETLVLGKANGNQTKVYDRGKKRKAKGQGWVGPTTTRVERRMRPQPPLALAKLGNLPNPFASLQLVVPQTAQPPDEAKSYIWEMFLDSVTVRGLTSASKLLPEEKRTTYRKWLLKHPIPWWDPNAVWAKWPAVLDELKIAAAENWW